MHRWPTACVPRRGFKDWEIWEDSGAIQDPDPVLQASILLDCHCGTHSSWAYAVQVTWVPFHLFSFQGHVPRPCQWAVSPAAAVLHSASCLPPYRSQSCFAMRQQFPWPPFLGFILSLLLNFVCLFFELVSCHIEQADFKFDILAALPPEVLEIPLCNNCSP